MERAERHCSCAVVMDPGASRLPAGNPASELRLLDMRSEFPLLTRMPMRPSESAPLPGCRTVLNFLTLPCSFLVFDSRMPMQTLERKLARRRRFFDGFLSKLHVKFLVSITQMPMRPLERAPSLRVLNSLVSEFEAFVFIHLPYSVCRHYPNADAAVGARPLARGWRRRHRDRDRQPHLPLSHHCTSLTVPRD